MIKELLDAVVSNKLLAIKLDELDKKVDRNDTKHTQEIQKLKDALIEFNEGFSTKLDDFMEEIRPYVEQASRFKKFINKWSPITAILLLVYILISDKAEVLFKLAIKLAG
jgi:hypothetical protein